MITCSGSFTVRCCLALEVSDCTRLPSPSRALASSSFRSVVGHRSMAASGNGEDVLHKLRLAMSSNSIVGTRAEPVVSYRGYLWARSYDDRRRIVERTGEKSQFGASCVCYKLLRFEAALTATDINNVGCPHHPRQLKPTYPIIACP